MGSLLSEYHEELQEKVEGRFGEFLYRGQENADWRLRSGAVRRIFPERSTDELQKLIEEYKEVFDFHEENLRYHEELLERAKLRGWHREVGGRGLEDLELLAKLQHHGAATCLLDFTTRFDVALWFACKEVQNEDKDGKVFVLNVDSFFSWDLWRIGSNDLECNISEILCFKTREAKDVSQTPQIMKNPDLWYWHPETLMGRMLSQGSRFLFGSEETLDVDNKFFSEGCIFDIEIKQACKKQLLDELKKHNGLSQENIFFDIHGFATINDYRTPFQRRDVDDYYQEGMRKIQTGNFLDAIKDFDRVTKLDSGHALAYHNRAALYWKLGKFEEARSDLQSARDSYELLGNYEDKQLIERYLKTLEELQQTKDDTPNFG